MYPPDEGEVLDEDPPEYDAVAGNFETDASERWGAKNVQIAPDFVQRKYAFGIQGIPRESTDWLEVYTDFPGAFIRPYDRVHRLTPLRRCQGRYSPRCFGRDVHARLRDQFDCV
jgi:hypothetical protein